MFQYMYLSYHKTYIYDDDIMLRVTCYEFNKESVLV